MVWFVGFLGLAILVFTLGYLFCLRILVLGCFVGFSLYLWGISCVCGLLGFCALDCFVLWYLCYLV